jgi:SAM-dependent methyltransferase
LLANGFECLGFGDSSIMMITRRLAAILSLPAGYRIFTRIVGGDVWRIYLAEYVKPAVAEKVLDIGCGPADILEYLPKVDYVGFDISSEYIEAATKRFGNRGRFFCNDVGLASIEQERGTFDLVLATGVVHHLDDDRAARLFELARRALRPNGRLITYDGCFVPEQSRIARWMLRNDRGGFVRTRPEYERLASVSFSKVEPYLRHDLLRIPYTHLIMRCSN